MGKIFAVTSGKGGVGKSTFCVGLALALSRARKRTVLIDMDEGLRCLDIILKADSRIVFDLADALASLDTGKALYKIEGEENLFLIPAPDKKGRMIKEKLSEFISKLSKEFDAVILDFPAGIHSSLYCLLPQKTRFLTVAVPDNISVRDAAAVNGALNESGRASSLIINRFDIKKMKKGLYRNIDDMIDLSGLRLLGLIPESKELSLLSVRHRIKKTGRTARAFDRVAARLLGAKVRLPKFKKI